MKNIDKLGNHLNAYKTYHDKLGKTLGTAVNHYNQSSSEFKKIDKDIIRMSDGDTQIQFEQDLLDRPLLAGDE